MNRIGADKTGRYAMDISLEIHPLDLQDYFETVAPGAVRIKGHRIGIEHIVRHYYEGYSPEQIAQEFPGLSLEKIYATIAYYLHNKAEIDDYMARLAPGPNRVTARSRRRNRRQSCSASVP
jgi:uncharacterized protein (DUF433 family)